MVDWYGIKVWHKSDSQEVYERIEWCKENDIKFITTVLRGVQVTVGGKEYTITEEEIKEQGLIELTEGAFTFSIQDGETPVSEIGMSFFFDTEENVTAFKLRWE